MKEKICRKYLEITSLSDLNDSKRPLDGYSLNLLKAEDFQLNKFLYKQIGKKYQWIDRLVWTDQKWINYLSNKNLLTYVLKDNDDLVGYYELLNHKEIKESEIIYFGILEEYFGKKLGNFLLSHAIKKSFASGSKRVWAHTCSLDHENALKNYLARGMKVFKSEIIERNRV